MLAAIKERVSNKKDNIIFKVLPIIISIVALVISIYSYRVQSTRNEIMIEKYFDDLSPTIKCKIDTSTNEIIFRSVETNKIIQGGVLVFPASITKKIYTYNDEESIKKEDLEQAIKTYVENKLNLISKEGFATVIKLPIPIIHNYNVSTKGKVLDLRNLSWVMYSLSVDDKGKIRGWEIENIYVIQLMGIPIKTHVFFHNPFNSSSLWDKVTRQDSLDVREILEKQLELRLEDIKNTLDKS